MDVSDSVQRFVEACDGVSPCEPFRSTMCRTPDSMSLAFPADWAGPLSLATERDNPDLV